MEVHRMNFEKKMGDSTSVRISEVVEENKETRTLFFQHRVEDLQVIAGHFFMIWIPGVDEIPMSISYWNRPILGISVLPIGDATRALASRKVGDWIGIRGPFGRPFSLDTRRALVVGGGIGAAPLRLLTYQLLARDTEVTLLLAARTKDSLVYFEEFSGLEVPGFQLEVATDDGSLGFKGLATEAAKEILKRERFNSLYTCGPEAMMKDLYLTATKHDLQFEASVERYMKCGCGICGTCALDPTGDLVCLDGPVFSGKKLSEVSDFGISTRDEMGRKKKC
jgi:dihydroorotate dehydrogenase electron transfer subunit